MEVEYGDYRFQFWRQIRRGLKNSAMDERKEEEVWRHVFPICELWVPEKLRGKCGQDIMQREYGLVQW